MRSILIRFLTLTSIGISVCASQHINEYPFPSLPLKNVSAGIIASENGFIIHGINSYSWNNEMYDTWGALHYAYFFYWTAGTFSPPFFLPDTMQDNYFGLGGMSERWKISMIPYAGNEPLVMWSTVRNQFGDVGPFLSLSSPRRSYAFVHENEVQQVCVDSMSMNPVIAADEDGIVHTVWESISAPIDDPMNNFFYSYTSNIWYQPMTVEGDTSGMPRVHIGKGFYPDIRLRNGTPYVLFIAADSSSSTSFSLRIQQGTTSLYSEVVYSDTNTYPYVRSSPVMNQTPFVDNLTWNVDSAEGVQAVWYDADVENKRIHIVHVSYGSSAYIDTSIQIQPEENSLLTRYTSDGEIRILVQTTSGVVRQFISRNGIPVIETVPFPLNSTASQLREFIIDHNDNSHAIVEKIGGIAGLYLIRCIGTDSATVQLLSSEYSAVTAGVIDTTNTVWLTGKRDSTPVLLSFNLDETALHPDFVFPLRAGNEWQYSVFGEPPSGSPILFDVQKIVGDTTVSTGRTYFVLTSKFLPHRYFRKDGLRIYQYIPKDSAEYLRFDFSRSAGDTLTFNESEPFRSIILTGIHDFAAFGRERREFTFTGSVDPVGQDNVVKVIDSIGITFSTAVGPTWELTGAKVNGKIFGTILSADESNISVPSEYSLSQNYPNPFNPVTAFKYQLPHRAFVTLKIYDAIGRETAVLVNEKKNAGDYTVIWNAEQFASGLYFVRMRTEKYTAVKKIILMK